jgi:hypothetical protein
VGEERTRAKQARDDFHLVKNLMTWKCKLSH